MDKEEVQAILDEMCKVRPELLSEKANESDKFSNKIDELTAESTEWESKCYILQEKINKAIEYIKKCVAPSFLDEDYEPCLVENEINELLKILEGVEDDKRRL